MGVYRVVLDNFLMSLAIAMLFSLLYSGEVFMHICVHMVNYIYAQAQGEYVVLSS